MNLFRKLFSRFQEDEEYEESDSEEIIYERSDVDFTKQEERTAYIANCLEQMADAEHEIGLLKDEYAFVTDCLTDIEEIEALPEEEHTKLTQAAMQLDGLEAEQTRFKERKSKMTDSEYFAMRNQESEIEEGISKIGDAEKYGKLVKKDLRRLDGEHHALAFRKKELEAQMSNDRAMAVIFGVAFAVCMCLLLFLQLGLEMDAFIGFFIAIAAVAVAETVVCVRYMDAVREYGRVNRESGEVVRLQNTVKIRYVNNRRLLEYLYLKYHVESGEKLVKLWKLYQQEKEERRQFTEAEAKSDFFRNQLVSLLKTYRVKYPERWIYQTSAILDKREMVEVRHSLILRRQALREQMDYNRGLAQDAKNEISSVARTYPVYAKEILEMTTAFERSL